MTTEITSRAQYEEIVKTHPYVLCDFYTTWCQPCKAMIPHVDHLAKEHPHIKFVTINAEDLEDVKDECEVEGFPTFLLLHNGREIDRLMGAWKGGLTQIVARVPQ